MSTITLIKGGATEVTCQVEELSDEQMFEAINTGVATLEHFKDWLVQIRRDEWHERSNWEHALYQDDGFYEIPEQTKLKYRLIGYKENKPVRKKLLAFGLTPGVELEVIRVAPLGDPIEIKVRSYALSLRKTEFDLLNLEEIKECKTCIKGCK